MKRLLILLGMWVYSSPAAAATVTRTASTGETFTYVLNSTGLVYRALNGDGVASRYDIAIIGDGYVDSVDDQRRLTVAAEAFTEGLFSVSPFTESKECINVWLINLVSTESGIDDPDQTLVRNTALDCTFVTGSMEIKGDHNKAAAVCALAGVPFDAIYVLVNDSKSHDGSWGDHTTAIAYSSDLFPWGTIMAHELGHVLGMLEDEYRAPDCDICDDCQPCPADCISKLEYVTYTAGFVPAEPNVTKESDAALVPWRDLMTTESFPTTIDSVSEGNVIGRWEGAGNLCFGIYRPREYCLMDGVTGDDPAIDDFCPVCKRALVNALATWYSCGTP